MAGPLSLRLAAGPWARHRVGLALLVVAVLVAHGCVTSGLSKHLAEAQADAAMPARIEVAYVRELAPAPPPVLAPPAAPAPAPAPRAAAPARAASAPRAARPPAPEPVPAPPVMPEPIVPLAVLPEAPAASAPEAAPAAAAVAQAPAASAAAFEWPASTRLTYKLSGNYRGEVQGDAQVEWVRAGNRYQVHLDVTVGAAIAPLITRRMSSDGELTELGLSPLRYDEDTKVMFRDRRRLTMLFEPDAVVLANGQRRARQPGTQDTASQFVQLSWLFGLHPEMLRVGNSVELPLALPRNVDRWVYDVIAEEPLATPFGELSVFHLKPRRSSRPGGDLSAEIWFAPQLRYLPARIRIQQDADTYIDLLIARPPELAGS